MTTYGPRHLSLADRLAVADAVVLFAGARLVTSSVDELSETTREIGVFELSTTDALLGKVDEPTHVRVVRDSESPWPIPEQGEGLALLQRDPPRSDWLLVHNSAFRLRRDGFVFSDSIEPSQRSEARERVSIDDVRRLIEAQRRRADKDASEL